MKKLFKNLPFVVLILVATAVSAQKGKTVDYEAPAMPVNEESNLISYGAVIDEKASKDELYKRAMNFMNSNYKNPRDVVKVQDNAKGEIEAMHRFKIFNPEGKDGVKGDAGMVTYTLNILLKDGKYKYEFSNITWKQASAYGIEKWMDKTSPSYKPNFDYYLIQTDEEMKDLEAKFKAAMKISSVEEKKADW
ncbi:MAG: DUF4468 domain-containing protein [Bacteroidetes bacterium]|nr:DUF4468 domain-containing protein [Bacteroidota bacterium]